LEEALEQYRALEDRRGIANVQWAFSNIHIVSNEWRATADTALEAFELFEELGDRFGAGWAAHSVGLALTPLGELAEARRYLDRAMRSFSEAGDLTGIGLVLNDFAALAATEKDLERAIRLRAASWAIEQEAGQALVSNMESYYSWAPDPTQSGLTSEQEARLNEEGKAMSVEEAVAYALEGKTSQAEVP
jgi:tetratricopeptide (TPR) repeat protein